jgi:hypothetical protein
VRVKLQFFYDSSPIVPGEVFPLLDRCDSRLSQNGICRRSILCPERFGLEAITERGLEQLTSSWAVTGTFPPPLQGGRASFEAYRISRFATGLLPRVVEACDIADSCQNLGAPRQRLPLGFEPDPCTQRRSLPEV